MTPTVAERLAALEAGMRGTVELHRKVLRNVGYSMWAGELARSADALEPWADELAAIRALCKVQDAEVRRLLVMPPHSWMNEESTLRNAVLARLAPERP